MCKSLVVIKSAVKANGKVNESEALVDYTPVVEEVVANHDENLVTITTNGDVAEADIKAAVEAAGYEYCGIR